MGTRIMLTTKQFEILQNYYDKCVRMKQEMMLLGLVKREDKDSDYLVIKDMFVPKQTSHGTLCEMDEEWQAKNIIMKGKYVNLWIHTHPGMGAFWSGTDDTTAEDLGSTCEYFVSIVIGSDYELLARVDVHKPVQISSDIPIEVERDLSLLAKCNTTFNKMVSRPPVPITPAHQRSSYIPSLSQPAYPGQEGDRGAVEVTPLNQETEEFLESPENSEEVIVVDESTSQEPEQDLGGVS